MYIITNKCVKLNTDNIRQTKEKFISTTNES